MESIHSHVTSQKNVTIQWRINDAGSTGCSLEEIKCTLTFIPYIKINSTGAIDINVKDKTINFLEKYIHNFYLPDLGLGKGFSNRKQKSLNIVRCMNC